MITTAEISPRDLPDWMRQAQRGVDWGAFLIFAFSLTIALPFLTQPNLPHTNASENYVYRTADYAAALMEGRFYPRWSADALGGYGAPIPHYYPPGAAYVPAMLQVLFTNNPVQAVRLVYAGSLALASTAVYALVARRFGARTGILAGFLYVCSPYIGLTAPYILGDLPGVMTAALIPALLWSTDRLFLNRPGNILLTALFTSALCLTSIRGLAAGLALATLMIVTSRQRVKWVNIVGSFAIGIGIASFYWLPALLEQDAIFWRAPIIEVTTKINFADLFIPLRAIDPNELITSPQFSLGTVHLMMAIAGSVVCWYYRNELRFQIFFLLAGGGLIVLVLLMPRETWLTAVISLCLAIVASSVTRPLNSLSPRFQRLLLPLVLTLIWISSSPIWITTKRDEDFGSTDSKALIQYEQQGYGIATLPPGDPIPVTIAENISFNRTLIEGYLANTINKIAPGQISQNFQAGILDHNTHSDYFQIRADSPILLNILTAYFPGWRASINDRPLLLTQNPENGLIQVDIPITRSGELAVVLGSTAERTGAWIISWSTLLIVLILTWGRYRRRRSFYEEASRLSKAEVRLLTVLLICFTSANFLLNNVPLPFSLNAPPGYQLQGTASLQTRSDAGLNLLAYRLPSNQYRAGDTIDLRLYWQAQRFLNANYRVKVYLVNNRDGRSWNAALPRHPGNYPTSRWTTGLYVTDVYSIQLIPDTPTGNYSIAVEAYNCIPDCTSGTPLLFFGNAGQVIGTTFILPILLDVSS